MADTPHPSVRSEIQNHLRCCDRMLSAALALDHVAYSPEEEGIVEYYAIALLKLIPRARSGQKYRKSIHEYVRLSEALLKVDDFTTHEKELTQTMLKQLSEKLFNKPQGE
jgi:hypothetical protein